MQAVLEIAAGVALLALGGELLVRGAVALARRLGVTPLLISLVVVGFGTSTPELVTSIEAGLNGTPGIAIGNIVGSNIANLLLALGAAAVLSPIAVKSAALRRDGGLLLAFTAAFVTLTSIAPLTAAIGALLLAGLLAYVAIAIFGERLGRSAAETKTRALEQRLRAEQAEVARAPLVVTLALVAGGFVGLLIGADYLVEGASALGRSLEVSEAILGLTVVAVGTSMPELVTSVLAARRGHPEVAFGNAIGSCIYNLLGIGGATAIVTPLSVPAQIITFDNPVMLTATIVVVAFAWTGGRIGRREGLALLTAYAAYLVWLWPR